MGTDVIEIEGLHKEYRRRRGRTHAVAGLDLVVPAGGVFGFLGPNGSGKTTTIRCLLGLVRPTRGRVRLLGHDVPARLPDVLGHVGAIVETPALLPTMSGRDNLVLLGALDHIGPRRVDAVLEQVGLAERADDPVRKYSLGMRQRLGLAAALLKDPALLVLDEPANGLDPAGMRSVRELVRALAAEGRTVFLSSHLLAEVQQSCDRVAILDRGRCITYGTVEEVSAAAGHRAALLARVAEPERAVAILTRAGMAAQRVDGWVRVSIGTDQGDRVSRALGAEDVWVRELRPEEHSLEDLFLEVTAHDGVRPGAEEVGV